MKRKIIVKFILILVISVLSIVIIWLLVTRFMRSRHVYDSLLTDFMLFITIFTAVCIIAGNIIAKTIAEPVEDLAKKIDAIGTGRDMKNKHGENGMFNNTFNNLVRIQTRLENADAEVKSMEQCTEWINNISHDMKSPLASIKGYSEIMKGDCFRVTEEDLRNYSKVINRNVDTLENLIDELNFGCMLEDGEIIINPHDVDICLLLKECCYEIPANYAYNDIIYEFEENEIHACVDRKLMKRCLVNIIGNAIIHNDNATITIGCRKDDGIIIEIGDDGYGIDEGELDKIFERHYRCVRSSGTEGSGLGLAIAKEIVEAHGGTIMAGSENGKGSVFTIRINSLRKDNM